MKKVFALLLALMLLLSLPLAAFAANADVANARTSVARVLVFDANNQPAGLGSAVAVGREGDPVQFFVTNEHVVRGASSISVIVGNASSLLNARLVDVWVEQDLAIICLDTASTFWQPITIADAQETVRVGDQIFAIGFPYTGDYTDGNFYNASAADATLTNGIVSSLNQVVESATGFRMDAVITNGSSGGAVVNTKGELVGIAKGGLDGNNYAIYSNNVTRFLDLYNVPYITAGGLGLVVIIVLVVAVLLVGAVVALLLTQKKPAANMNHNMSGGDEGKTMAVQPVKPSKPAATSVRVTCIAGPMKGATYTAKDHYSFGRDKSCSVVFPDKTPGVSGKHCALYITNGKITIKDLQSTHGTFLGDGTKLTHGASYPLSRGDTFYLGSKEVGFMIG